MAVVLVIVSSVFLAGLDTGRIDFGRGEWETQAAILVFTVQILVVDAPHFAVKDPLRMSALVFLGIVVFLGVTARVLMGDGEELLRPSSMAARHWC